jgi:cbb3-type cytochrome oxidase subunit 1/mono/diheme cytochrome c family protein
VTNLTTAAGELLTTEETPTQVEFDTGTIEISDAGVNLHLRLGALFLLAGALLGLVLAVKLSAPEFLNVEGLGYGRLQPLFTGSLLYGWLVIAGLGAIYYVLPRLTAVPVSFGSAVLSLGLILAGVVVGLVAVWSGETQARSLFEFPWYADLLLGAGLAVAAATITANARSHREPRRYVSLSFFVGGVWWLLVGFVVAALPWFDGVDQELASRFSENLVLLMWVISFSLGVAYYLVPKVSGRPLYSERLGFISFWSLAPAAFITSYGLTFGPGPDWLETIGVLFAVALLIPAMAAIANLAMTLGTGWREVTGSTPLLFTAATLFFLALLVIQVLGLALRASSSIVQFTAWTEASFLLPTAIGSCAILALAYHRSGRSGTLAFGAFAGGMVALIGVLWLSGLQAGLTWIGSGGSRFVFENYGEGFVNTTAALAGLDALRWLAWLTVAAGLVVAGFEVARAQANRAEIGIPGEYEVAPEAGDLTPGTVAVAAIGLALASLAITVIIPVSEVGDPTLRALSTRDYEAFADGGGSPQAQAALAELGLDAVRVADGRDVYLSQGCMYCHTQQVRANVTDAGLGAVTVAEDVALENPVTLGRIRIGPDLAHAGLRPGTDDRSWLATYLRDPASVRNWTAMPSYDYLSDDELDSLVQYLMSLR